MNGKPPSYRGLGGLSMRSCRKFLHIGVPAPAADRFFRYKLLMLLRGNYLALFVLDYLMMARVLFSRKTELTTRLADEAFQQNY